MAHSTRISGDPYDTALNASRVPGRSLSRQTGCSIICVLTRINGFKTCRMKTSASRSSLPLPAEDALLRLGGRINLVRRARYLTQADLASKSGVSLSTMAAIESGSPTVQMGFYLNVLFALDALEGLENLAVLAEDAAALGRLSETLPKRVRR